MQTRPDIRRILHPQTVAVIGASEDSGKFGGRVLEYLLKFGYPGNIVPVNARVKTVRGLPSSMPTLCSLPAVAWSLPMHAQSYKTIRRKAHERSSL